MVEHRKRFLVFAYHGLSHADDKYVTTPEMFRRHIAFLLDAGCSFVSMDMLLQWRAGQAELPKKAVALHFDDARDDIIAHAAPLLTSLGIPSTIFVVSAWSAGRLKPQDKDAYSDFLTWRQLRELHETGLFAIGAHGETHCSLKRAGFRQKWREIAGSKSEIEDAVGCTVRHLAAPYNRSSLVCRIMARAAGLASLSVGRSTHNSRGFNPYGIKRFMVTREWDEAFLKQRLEIAWPSE
ncbi:polysaccharide deacetylase family protein [Desulfocurvibacter africanus]|uniref:polysaccharide deacetylase family protein n=1 Tax=Desulfocurvibacter africanus TaxID=873 RepID=UPI002FDA1D55